MFKLKDEFGQLHCMRVWMRFARDSNDSIDKYIE